MGRAQAHLKINPGCVSSSPGIVTALPLAVNAFTSKGDKVMIQPPVYPPFFACIKDTGRNIVTNPLINNKGYFEIDFEDFENKLKSGVKLFILCSPHQSCRKVLQREELKKIGRTLRQNGVLILSDQITAIWAYSKSHIPMHRYRRDICHNSDGNGSKQNFQYCRNDEFGNSCHICQNNGSLQ